MLSQSRFAPAHIASALLMVSGLLVAACSGSSDGGSGGGGESLYNANCAACHGKDGRGTALNLGPSFLGIKPHWDESKVLEYIADPKAFASKVERLGKRDMAAVADTVTPEQRKQIVRHALSLMN